MLLRGQQLEHDMIIQRTQEDKTVARHRSRFSESRSLKFATEQLDHAMTLLADHSYAQVVKLTGISKSTLIREKSGAVSSASRKNKGASIAVRGSSFWVI